MGSGRRLASTLIHCVNWRKIPITLINPCGRVLSVIGPLKEIVPSGKL